MSADSPKSNLSHDKSRPSLKRRLRSFVLGEQDPNGARNKLLQFLQDDIQLRLASSLHNLVKLDLYLEDQRQQVGKPSYELVPEDVVEPELGQDFWVNRVLRSDGTEKLVPLQQTKIIDVFKRSDINRKLLILGEPGSGKTTELLHLAQELTNQAIDDVRLPIPVILELSAWKGESIEDWIASRLKKRFNLQQATIQQWLDSNQLLLLLDGLDELGLTNQSKCIKTINTFIEQQRLYGLVVCCRRKEYEAGNSKLYGLNGAVYLESLTEAQVEDYFGKLNRRRFWETVRSAPALLELARKPLFLFMLVVAYQGQPIGDEEALFDAYIQKQLSEPSNQGTYPKNKGPTTYQTCHYLVSLAKQLERLRETEFLIEGLQPDWLPEGQQRVYKGIVGLIVGLFVGPLNGLFVGQLNALIFGLIFGLICGPLNGLIFGLIGGLGGKRIELTATLKFSLRGALISGLISGLSAGLSAGLLYGLLNGLIFGLIFGLIGEQIEPNETLQFSIRRGLITGLVVVLIFGLIVVLIGGLSLVLSYGLIVGLSYGLSGELSARLSFVLSYGLIGVPIFGLFGGLIVGLIEDKTTPNQGILMSLHNALIVGPLSGLIFGLIGGLIISLRLVLPYGLSGLSVVLSSGLSVVLRVGLFYGLIGALIGTLIGGLGAVIQHFVLRLFLTQNKYTPWNYARFLDHAVKHRFIQKTGGRYRFVHDRLRKHFAAMSLERG